MLAATILRWLPAVRGRAVLGRLWASRYGSEDEELVIKMNRGHTMAVPCSSRQTWRAAFTGSYDDAEIDMLSRFIAPGEWSMDIGASLGFYTIPLARYGKVVAVEPIAGNRIVLERNLQLNQLESRVRVLATAFGSNRASVTMEVEVGGRGNAALTDGVSVKDLVRHRRAGHLGHSETIEVERLDDVSDLPDGRCSVIKLDVEGYELEVLAGAVNFVSSHRPLIFGEFNREWLESRGSNARDVTDWASNNGYGLLGLQSSRTSRISDRYVLTPTQYVFGSSVLLVP
jgi:FkbM family methyltransferase